MRRGFVELWLADLGLVGTRGHVRILNGGQAAPDTGARGGVLLGEDGGDLGFPGLRGGRLGVRGLLDVVAGVLDHRVGGRNLHRLGGLARPGDEVADLADLTGQGLDELAHVGAGLLGALGEELVGVGHDGRGVLEPVVDGVDDALAVGGVGQQVGHAAHALEDRVGVTQEPGRQDEGAFLGARVRQGEDRVGGGQALDLDDVDVDGARAPALVALATELTLDAAGLGEQLVGGRDRGADDDGVPIVGLRGLAGGQHGLGAHDRRDVVDLEALHVGQGLDRMHEGHGHVPEVAADRQDDAARAQVRRTGGVFLALCLGGVRTAARRERLAVLLLGGAGGLGAPVGLDLAGEDGTVLGLVNTLEGQRQGHRVGLARSHGHGHVREGVVDRGVGLVDGDLCPNDALVAHDARGDGFGEGLDEVDGGAGEDGHGLVGDVRVGDGGGDVVGGAGSLDPHDDVGAEALVAVALEVVDAVVGQRPESFQGDDDASVSQRRSPFGRWPPRWLLRRGPARPTRQLPRSRRRCPRCSRPRRLRGP